MAISPVVLKGLVGVGAVSVTATGIVFREKIYEKITGSVNYLKKLNIPKKCEFPSTESPIKTCELTKQDLGNINFEDKDNPSIPEGTKTQLKIEKINDINAYHGGLKFTFKNNKDIKIKTVASGNENIILASETNTEFKINSKKDGTYSLEKAWNITTFAKQAGLNCNKGNNNENKCTLESDRKINVFKDNSNYTKGATFSLDSNKSITFSENEKGYNQGFKFKVSDNLNLSGGTTTGALSQITKDDKSYEIGLSGLAGDTDLFLIEKDEQKIKEKLSNLECSTSSGDSSSITCGPISGQTIKGITLENNKKLKREKSSNEYTYSIDPEEASGTAKKYTIDCSKDECSLKEKTGS